MPWITLWICRSQKWICLHDAKMGKFLFTTHEFWRAAKVLACIYPSTDMDVDTYNACINAYFRYVDKNSLMWSLRIKIYSFVQCIVHFTKDPHKTIDHWLKMHFECVRVFFGGGLHRKMNFWLRCFSCRFKLPNRNENINLYVLVFYSDAVISFLQPGLLYYSMLSRLH